MYFPSFMSKESETEQLMHTKTCFAADVKEPNEESVSEVGRNV